MEDNQSNYIEQDECVSRGICSISPALSSMHAVIRVYIEELAYYLLELDMFGASNETIKKDIIESTSGVISNVEYSQEHLNQVISKLYGHLYKAKELYIELCEKKGVAPFYLKSPIKISKQFDITDVIKQGQKYFIKKER